MPKRPLIRTFSSGDSDFAPEGDFVRVLGLHGTEAVIPLNDLADLLKYLEATEAPPPMVSDQKPTSPQDD